MDNIIDFFDEDDINHLKAYKHLCDTGCWPENFVPEGTEFPTSWHFIIAYKLANAYLDHVLNDFN